MLTTVTALQQPEIIHNAAHSCDGIRTRRTLAASSIVILLGFLSDAALAFRTAILISASGDNLCFLVVSSSPLRTDFLTTFFSFPLSFFLSFAYLTVEVDSALEYPVMAEHCLRNMRVDRLDEARFIFGCFVLRLVALHDQDDPPTT